MVGLGTVAGIPDLLAVRCGNLFCLELKSPAGRLTEAQAAMIARLERSRCGDPQSLEAWNLLRGCSD